MENLKALADTPGQTENFIKANGSTAWNTALECGKEPKATPTLDSGNSVKLTGMGYTHGLTVIATKANSKIALSTVKVFKDLLMVTSTKAFMPSENPQVSVNTTGPMAATSKAHLKPD